MEKLVPGSPASVFTEGTKKADGLRFVIVTGLTAATTDNMDLMCFKEEFVWKKKKMCVNLSSYYRPTVFNFKMLRAANNLTWIVCRTSVWSVLQTCLKTVLHLNQVNIRRNLKFLVNDSFHLSCIIQTLKIQWSNMTMITWFTIFHFRPHMTLRLLTNIG